MLKIRSEGDDRELNPAPRSCDASLLVRRQSSADGRVTSACILSRPRIRNTVGRHCSEMVKIHGLVVFVMTEQGLWNRASCISFERCFLVVEAATRFLFLSFLFFSLFFFFSFPSVSFSSSNLCRHGCMQLMTTRTGVTESPSKPVRAWTWPAFEATELVACPKCDQWNRLTSAGSRVETGLASE